MIKRRYTLVVFDWDGTVVDSVPNIVEALKRSAIDLQLPVLEDPSYKGVIGLSLVPAAQALYPDAKDDVIAEYIEGYIRHVRALDEQAPQAFKGALAGIKQLRKQGVKLAVATGKGRTALQTSIEANGFDSLMDLCKTSDDARSKPDPDMLEQLLNELDVPREQALLVGDSGFDLQMAKNAGIDRVAVSYGAQSVSELERWQPVYIADSFADLMYWLQSDQLSEIE